MNLWDLVFPINCLGCRKGGKYLCPQCLSKVRTLPQVCPYCEKPSIDGFTHFGCSRKRGLDGLTSVWKYEGVIKNAIWALKFKYATEVGRELSRLLTNNLLKRESVVKQATLVPIALHWHKENVRGFNQSGFIGKTVAENLGWQFAANLLIKRHATISQVELSVEDRRRNLKGVFEIAAGKIPPIVVLFDDVFTTGSTLNEAAIVLKNAGVGKVWGLTLAR